MSDIQVVPPKQLTGNPYGFVAPYTTEELAKWWKVTPRTIQRLVKDNELQGFKLGKGGDWRFPQGAVEDFILRNSGRVLEGLTRSPRLGRKKAA
jgi:excisionase family DNA binding protein